MRQGKLAAFTRRLGVYKFLPLFFLLGAGIELFMIKVRVGRETFCKYPSRTKTQVVGFLELIDQKILARVIDQTWTVKKAGYRLRFFITFWGTETKWRSEKLQKERSNIKSSHVNNWTCRWSVSDMGKRLFPAGWVYLVHVCSGFSGVVLPWSFVANQKIRCAGLTLRMSIDFRSQHW